MSYDPANIFARILRGEIPCKALHDDAYALAFPDIHPQAPTHILVIPKGAYESLADFSSRASAAEIEGFWRAVAAVVKAAGVDGPGFRLITNNGAHAHQEVPHFHVHILGGRPLGPMVVKAI